MLRLMSTADSISCLEIPFLSLKEFTYCICGSPLHSYQNDTNMKVVNVTSLMNMTLKEAIVERISVDFAFGAEICDCVKVFPVSFCDKWGI